MITDYMRGDQKFISPIMTNYESIWQFGNNAYGKPATALNILRETVMGRELFDFAFKTYCERWKFKHPTPADLFRTMEDASGVDLDWFWRGWFYSTEYVDVSLDYVKQFELNSNNPEVEKAESKKAADSQPQFIGDIRNKESIKQTVNERDTTIDDFYAKRDIYKVDRLDKKEYDDFQAKLTPEQKKLLDSKKQFYELAFTNKGGLVTPLIIQAKFEDGSTQEVRIPAEIWRMDDITVTKVLIFDKPVVSFQLDPFLETADCDVNNNSFPPASKPTRFQLFQQKQSNENPMQRQKRLESGN